MSLGTWPHAFWRALSIAALGIAATGVAALVAYLAHQHSDIRSFLDVLSALSPLRFFLAPLFALAFLLSALFAPARSSRIALLGAAAIETVVFTWVAVMWFHRGRIDLTIPYTFYPLALPHWIAWTLFLAATVGGAAIGVARGRARGWMSGLGAGLIGGVGFLVVTMVASMVITFFVHDL
ncbi:MAG TPA: hypothetical protein VKF40_11085 [Burkholderiales bacterium]|nr:hypothetical protein [Burkholderiales bacterium]